MTLITRTTTGTPSVHRLFCDGCAAESPPVLSGSLVTARRLLSRVDGWTTRQLDAISGADLCPDCSQASPPAGPHTAAAGDRSPAAGTAGGPSPHHNRVTDLMTALEESLAAAKAARAQRHGPPTP